MESKYPILKVFIPYDASGIEATSSIDNQFLKYVQKMVNMQKLDPERYDDALLVHLLSYALLTTYSKHQEEFLKTISGCGVSEPVARHVKSYIGMSR